MKNETVPMSKNRPVSKILKKLIIEKSIFENDQKYKANRVSVDSAKNTNPNAVSNWYLLGIVIFIISYKYID